MNLITDTRGRKGSITLTQRIDLVRDIVTFTVNDCRRGHYATTDYATLHEAHKAFDALTQAFDEV